MRTLIAPLALVLTLTAAPDQQAEAQGIGPGPGGAPRVFTGPGGPVALTPGAALYAPPVGPGAPSGIGSYVPPYSYYAALPSMSPRIYVDYAQSGFVYHGHPYGHPYDRWSWAYLGDMNRNVLARYYYPPVR